MSKTDHMRALREARFTRSSPSASRRMSPAPADAAPSRPSRPVAPADKPARPAEAIIAAAVDDRITAEPVITEPVITEPVIAEPVIAEPVIAEPVFAEPVVLAVPATVTPAFEIPTLDIPFPAAVPRVRDTPNPNPTARVCETPPSPVSQQIIIPALDLPEPEEEPFRTPPSPQTAIDSPDAAIVAGPAVASTHVIAPGQPIAAYSLDDLAAVVRSITGDGTPRDAAAIVAAVMTELGFKRKGRKITDAITAAAISTGALADQPVAPDLGIPAIAS